MVKTWILEIRYNTNHNVNTVLVSEMVSSLKLLIEGQLMRAFVFESDFNIVPLTWSLM